MNDGPSPTRCDLLRKLLGPDGPEVSCEECFAQLDRYVELELELGHAEADAKVPGLREHLEGCSACDEDYRSLRALVESEIGSTQTDE